MKRPLVHTQLFIMYELYDNALRTVWTMRQVDWPEGKVVVYHASITPFN